ncbi:MAG: secondary thiamine-phosphate synthase enzyme YjbQ [Kordiimonadaceae bacterium]|nr:secondary thiamine-phosphate synthase enzyme YjbQ [Kordiimonadaceae bacterium]
MQQQQTTLAIQTQTIGLYEITTDLATWVYETGVENGLLTLMVQHTSASLTIQENADPTVQPDLIDALDRLVPMDPKLYRHIAEGADDMPAHIKSALTNVSLSIPVQDRQMRLGTWQGVFLLEHRQSPHTRRIACHLLGDF